MADVICSSWPLSRDASLDARQVVVVLSRQFCTATEEFPLDRHPMTALLDKGGARVPVNSAEGIDRCVHET
jgi:hypothetical protein